MLDFVIMRSTFCRGVVSDTSYLFLSRIVPRPRRARESAIRLIDCVYRRDNENPLGSTPLHLPYMY